ncbi:MAG: HDOD domain-containing protein [Desulfobacteraceae bacterium]|nr:MAG: HDOD domain-containing protein [Desulfobacteraceae bacterium]
MNKLNQLIQEIDALTPMPAIANQLVEALNRDDCSAQDIAAIIQFDPSATANLLKACNSAYYGLSNPVESIKDAVSILGTDTLVELVLLKSSAETLSINQEGYGHHEGSMWRHAVSSAMIAKAISEKKQIGNKNTIFTAALLKDIGKTVLDRYVSGSFEKINTLVRDRGVSFREAEKKVLGIDHAELSALVAKQWNFSSRMVHMIRHHHLADPSVRDDLEIVIVYLSDCICMMMGIGLGADGLAYRFHADAIRSLDMSHDDIAMIIADFTVEMTELEDLLKLV